MFDYLNRESLQYLIKKLVGKMKDIINTTSSTLEGSYAGGLVINEIQGKTEQNAYTGKNLFKMREDSTGNFGLTVTFDVKNQTLSTTGTATNGINIPICGNGGELTELITKGGTFVLSLTNASYDANKCNISIAFADSVGTKYITANGTPVTVASGSTLKGMNLWVPKDTAINLSNVKIQLEENNVATEWEPYVGGKPSPSPSYPQEIKSVKGKNLLDCRGLVEKTNNGVTFTPIYDSNGNLLYVNANGTASANAEFEVKPNLTNNVIDKANSYILSGCPNGGSDTTYRMVYTELDASWGGTGVSNKDYGAGVLLNHTDKVKYSSIRIDIFSGTVCNNLKFYPMIRQASIKDATYVPYGLLRIKTHGNDFLDDDDLLTWYKKTGSNVYRKVFKLKPNTDYTISQVINSHEGLALVFAISGSDLDFSPNTINNGVTTENKRIVTSDADGYITVGMYKEGKGYCHIYETSEISEITLSEPIELNGFNGVYDVVTSDGVTRRFAEVVFDGSDDENWGYYISNNVGFLINLDLVSTIKIPTTTHDVPNVLCSIAKVTSRDDLSNSDNNFAVAHNANIALYSSQFNNEADWRTFLQSNPMTVVYELATPTTEELPTADITALNSLKTFDGTTYVEVDCEGNPIIDMDYGCSKVGGITLESLNTARRNEVNIKVIQESLLSLKEDTTS